jgi:ribonucleotide monophosphatase NagD (HAD superfamily)
LEWEDLAKLKLIFILIPIGVLWLGEQAIAGSSDFVDFLANNGKRIIVLTNNATKSRAVYAKKLAQLGYGRCINEVSDSN